LQEKSSEDNKNLETEKKIIEDLQAQIYAKTKQLDFDSFNFQSKEIEYLKQTAIMSLKDRLLSRIYDRKLEHTAVHKNSENIVQPNLTIGIQEHEKHENQTNVLSGINSKSESETVKDEENVLAENSVNVSSGQIINNMPSSRGLSILKKEQELEEQLKSLEEEKRKLKSEKEFIEKERLEIENMKIMMKKEAESGKVFSFAKCELKTENEKTTGNQQNLANENKEVKKEEKKIEKIEESEEELEFKPDPMFLQRINENIAKTNELITKDFDNINEEKKKENLPDKENNLKKEVIVGVNPNEIPIPVDPLVTDEKMEQEEVDEDGIPKVRMSICKSFDGEEEKPQDNQENIENEGQCNENQEIIENNEEIKKEEKNEGLLFRSQDEESSEESAIYKEEILYDEPKKGKYGIRPMPEK